MSTNFKRFVIAIGPVFWLQDRIEEILLWKTGQLLGWQHIHSSVRSFPRILDLLANRPKASFRAFSS